jgi:hypothetical protein
MTKVPVFYRGEVEIKVPRVAEKVAVRWKFGQKRCSNKLERRRKGGNCLPPPFSFGRGLTT